MIIENLDSDEPLLSGSGDVSQVVAEDVLSAWQACIDEWRDDLSG